MGLGKWFEKTKNLLKSELTDEEFQKRKTKLERKIARQNDKARKFIDKDNFYAADICLDDGKKLKRKIEKLVEKKNQTRHST